MAPYNSELVKKGREILFDQERERAFSILDCFLMDLNASFNKRYQKGFNSRKEFINFMDDLLYLEYEDKKESTTNKVKEPKAITCKQEFYKIIREEGEFKIKQLVLFTAGELRKYFSFFELDEISSSLRVGGEEAGEEVPIERVFDILDEQEANLLGYDYGGSHPPKYYTILEADIPRINAGFIEYFDAIEEE